MNIEDIKNLNNQMKKIILKWELLSWKNTR